jgi:tRNA (adenine22-N1)-methyltransferase
MEELNLSDRLRLIAGLIKKGSKVADIGTDHGYLPIFLVKSGITDRVIAMDVRKGPLKKAEDNTRAFCVSDQIELRLSDGLAALEKGRYRYHFRHGWKTDTVDSYKRYGKAGQINAADCIAAV